MGQTFRHLCKIMLVSAIVLPCSRAFAQGCGLAVTPADQSVPCVTGEIEESYCEGAGDPTMYCYEGHGECKLQNGQWQPWTTADVQSDPSCGGGDGGGGGGDGPPNPNPPDPEDPEVIFGGHGTEGANAGMAVPRVFRTSDVFLGEQERHGGETMKASALLLAGVCVAPLLCAQQAPTPVIELKAATKKVETPVALRSAWSGGAVCDGAGNIYVRLLESERPGTQERAAVPIRKIGPDGSLLKSFRVLDAFRDDITGKGVDLMGRGVFVTADGRVFQTADVHGDTFVVEFAQDGSVRRKTKLVAGDLVQAWSWRFAVFKSGEYLLTASTGKDHLTPFAGVFGADGRLIKKIYEKEDEEAHQRSSPTDLDSFHPYGVVVGADFVRSGDVAASSDGNLYLLRGTNSPALVYVISPTGEVVRKLRIDASDPDMVAKSIRSYAGQLAVQFGKWIHGDLQQDLIKVTDLKGNPISDYEVPIKGNHFDFLPLAGYSSGGFTFSPYDNGSELYLVKAKIP